MEQKGNYIFLSSLVYLPDSLLYNALGDEEETSLTLYETLLFQQYRSISHLMKTLGKYRRQTKFKFATGHPLRATVNIINALEISSFPDPLRAF